MPSASATGRKVAGRYILEDTLGKGGMGVVWRAHDELLGRTVAVKEITFPSHLGEAEREALRARALREARAAARLNHQSVVAVYDAVEERGRVYTVMEYVDAPSLAQVISNEGPLDPGSVARIGRALLDALSVAHRNGIVHRDVKPGNIMVLGKDRAKLADFGIASVKDDPKLTATGMVLGSPQFMAPEQAEGSEATPATDLWALGATLYFATEGHGPFDRGNPIPTLAAVVHDEPEPPRHAGRLTELILALLSKDPQARPPATEVAHTLEGAEAPAQPAAVRAPAPKTGRPEEPARPPADRRRRGRGALPVALLALFLAGAGIAFLLTRGAEEPPPREEPDRAEDAETAPDDAPDTWTSYEDPDTGYRISHPPGWEVVRLDGTRTDFRDPSSGTYLRIDWTATPGPSPEGAWRDLSQSFAATRSNYTEIGITPTTYKGYDAALWEYTYTDGGADLHAYNLGFVTGDYGFALNFQTRAEDWAASQLQFERFKRAFVAPD